MTVSPLFENNVWYDRQDYSNAGTRKEYGLTKIYLYRWTSPSGYTGIDHVYVSRHAEFLALLSRWSKDGWIYTEL